MRDNEGKVFRIILHFGKWKFSENYIDTIDKLADFYLFVKKYVPIPIEPELKLYPIEDNEEADKIENAVNRFRERVGENIIAICDYPNRYKFDNKRQRSGNKVVVYDLPCPAFFRCNKCLILRIKPNGPFVTHGYCCGETWPLATFLEDFRESKFVYDITRDWTFCRTQITSHSQKGYKVKLDENESAAITCWEGHKLEEYKC